MAILIVDDSKGMRMVVKRTLKQAGYGDYDVVEAESGEEALGIIETEIPELVLADWNMPGMLGIEMVEKLVADGVDVKVGMVTSRGSQEMRDRATEAGALFLLTKPFSPETFRAALEPVL